MIQANGSATWCGLDLRWVYSELLNGIFRRTACVHRAHDVLHDALLRYALADARVAIAEPHAYLRTVVGSVLADHRRDATRYVALPTAEEAAAPGSGAGWGAEPAFYPSAAHVTEVRQRLQAVQRILDALPPRCGEVFWLFRIEGHTQPEIAARLRISLNMVERHVMRALIDLRAARELLSA